MSRRTAQWGALAGAIVMLVVTVVTATGAGLAQSQTSAPATVAAPAAAVAAAAPAVAAPAAAPADPVVAVAGDIACTAADGGPYTDSCRQGSTAALVAATPGLTKVLPLGDEQYSSGSPSEFAGSYNPSWGQVKALTAPVPGNHEYTTAGAAGYYGYFGALAGDPTKGYYSYNLGAWHLIALNANCSDVGGCSVGSAQETWLKADLAANTQACTLAYWHQPRFTEGDVGEEPAVDPFWRDLYAAKADLVLNGHSHSYERYALQDPNQTPVADGIRELVVGTGGVNLGFFPFTEPNLETSQANTIGIVRLTLHAASYNWNFVPDTGSGSYTDAGSTVCHHAPTTPGAPTGVTAVAGNASANVSWTAPSFTGGSPITGYTVTSSPGGFTATAGGSATSAVVGGLTNGTSYTFTVVATNGSGTGAPSAPSNAITAGSLPPTVTGVSPSSGPSAGGTAVTISGSNLTGPTSVTFGGVPATGVAPMDAGHVNATTPAGSGVVAVSVTTGGGTGSLASAFTYITPPSPVALVQSAQAGSGSTTTFNLALSKPVAASDLLVGWFGQYNSSGSVQVKDNVNGAWTRANSETWSSAGDIALYYVQNSAAAPSGLTITLSSTSATYLEAIASDYSGIATTGALDKASVASGVGTTPDSGATAAVPAGELIFAAEMTGGSPSSVKAGASAGVTAVLRTSSSSGSRAAEDVIQGAAGPQNGRFTFGASTDWHAVGAAFKPIVTTPPDTQPPTVPAGLTATVSASSATLSWQASSDNVAVTGYTVYRNNAFLTTTGASTLTYTDPTVGAPNTYVYTVDAFDAAGNHSARSSPVTVIPPDTQPPTVPAALAATAVSATSVSLSWHASTDNVGVAGYTVYRNNAFLATTTATTYTDPTVAPSTPYTYAVDAYDAATNHSARTATLPVTTPAPPDTVPPTVPGGLTATSVSASSVTLSWQASTDDVAVTGYTVYRNNAFLATTTATTYTDPTVAGSKPYTYAVDAYDAAANHSAQSSSVSVTTPAPPDTSPPTVPTGLTTTAVSTNSVTLSWQVSTDNVGVAGYTVYRNNAFLATTTATSYTDPTVAPSTPYTYAVDAYDAATNHSARSTPLSVTTPTVPDTQPPTVPAGLTATAVSASSVSLSWQASSDNVGVTGYTVYRNHVALGTTAGLTYNDTTVAPSTPYTYTVDAFDAANNHSNPSSGVAVTTPTPPDTQPPTVPTGVTTTAVSSSSVALAWQASSDNVGVTGYTVYRNNAFLATTGAGTTSYIDPTVSSGNTYIYTVDAFDAANNHSARSAPVTAKPPDTQPPTVPAGLTATAVSTSSVTLSWQASTDNVGVTGYTVYRNNAFLATTTATTYTDPTVAPSTTYTYALDAYDAATNHSAHSTGLGVTTPAQPPPTVVFVQSASGGTGSTVTSFSLAFTKAVPAGSLLVGWFGQYSSAGQVGVRDNINGAWTRANAETWSSGSGDIALYYVRSSLAAPSGLTITLSSTAATYLEGSASNYSGLSASAALDKVSVAKGVSTAADSGATVAVPAGELVFAAEMTGGGPSSAKAGTSNGATFVLRSSSSSGSEAAEDVISSLAGAQNGRFTLGTSTDWYAAVATFKP